MYLPAAFEESRPDVLQALIREFPLASLVTLSTSGELAANSIPFLLEHGPAGGPGILRGHVARANPVWREARTDLDALVVFRGPQVYVSPSLYPGKADTGKVVPTWNYAEVQARGRLRAVEDRAWLLALVSRLTERHEAARPAPWAVTDAPADYIESMLGAIVGIELTLSALSGKWKVSQNRSAADRSGVMQGLRAQGDANAVAMAGLVAGHGPPPG
ncbi:MAG: FMN-binding negative transcriptional regulator [Pseudomonadota bacterium]|nr:FMN-binding negative transcriptional regulator [Pseudomonadota bacterium]